MPFLPSLKSTAGIGDIFNFHPELKKPMFDLARVIMRDDSVFSEADREVIAAYVSSLNKCEYCLAGHRELAVKLGTPREVMDAIIEDIETAPISEKHRTMLRFINKLTLTPHEMTQSDADAVYAAGWDERALHDAIMVCCRFSFMNRMSLGHGLDPYGQDPAARAANMNYDKKEVAETSS